MIYTVWEMLILCWRNAFLEKFQGTHHKHGMCVISAAEKFSKPEYHIYHFLMHSNRIIEEAFSSYDDLILNIHMHTYLIQNHSNVQYMIGLLDSSCFAYS